TRGKSWVAACAGTSGREQACGKTHTLYFFQTAQPVSPARRVDDWRESYKAGGSATLTACETTMIAPAPARAPRMLLVIGEDEQGLPTETIIPEPSVSQLWDALRVWLAAMLPNWLGGCRGRTRPDVDPLAASEPALIDVRVRWAGL